MQIRTFVLGGFAVSAYILHDGAEAILIDAPEGADQIAGFCDDAALRPRVLVNTHGHADHIHANAALKKRWPDMTIAIGRDDGPLLRSPMRNLSVLLGAWIKSPEADRLLDDGDRIEVGTIALQVLATPGHSKGGISLYSPDGPGGRPVVFTGDALFAAGIGRTDMPGMSHETLIRSIRDRLLTLPPETVAYPGHGPATTIADEARSNPWL